MVIWVKTIIYFSIRLSLKISVNGVCVRVLTCRLIDTRNYEHQGNEVQFSGITNKKKIHVYGSWTDH